MKFEQKETKELVEIYKKIQDFLLYLEKEEKTINKEN